MDAGQAPAWLQFILSLCLYDSFLTLVELNQQARALLAGSAAAHTPAYDNVAGAQALLADMTLLLHERTEMNSAASVMSVFGSASVFVSYWARGSLPAFRLFVLVIALISAAGFTVAAAGLRRLIDPHPAPEPVHAALERKPREPLTTPITVAQYASQMVKHSNFVWFSCMNVVQARAPSCAEPHRANVEACTAGVPLPLQLQFLPAVPAPPARHGAFARHGIAASRSGPNPLAAIVVNPLAYSVRRGVVRGAAPEQRGVFAAGEPRGGV
jgi:hypothetical protein